MATDVNTITKGKYSSKVNSVKRVEGTWISSEQAAEMLGVTVARANHYAYNDDEVKAVRISGVLLFSEDSVQKKAHQLKDTRAQRETKKQSKVQDKQKQERRNELLSLADVLTDDEIAAIKAKRLQAANAATE